MNRRIAIGLVGAFGALAACVTVAQPPQPPQGETASEATARAPAGHPASIPLDVSGVIVGDADMVIDEESGYAESAFPPTLPDTEWHHEAWERNDCLRCHETGVGDAPRIRHIGLPAMALVSKCRTCHVIEPGKVPTGDRGEVDDDFMPNAFPPMIPNSISHGDAWANKDCLMCHQDGVRDAPIIKHEGLPRLNLQSKCRTCHVQVRSDDADRWEDR